MRMLARWWFVAWQQGAAHAVTCTFCVLLSSKPLTLGHITVRISKKSRLAIAVMGESCVLIKLRFVTNFGAPLSWSAGTVQAHLSVLKLHA